jgi:Phospholipase_D-nuclease N-terminal
MIMVAEINGGLTLLALLLGTLVLAWLYALINCLRRSDFSQRERVAWVMVILFTSYLGLIVYFMCCGRGERLSARRYQKAIDPISGKPTNHAPF